MRLTKQRAIKEHRKMWNQIADWYESDSEEIKKIYNIQDVKRVYMRKNHYYGIMSNCFCCEYSNREEERRSDDVNSRCDYCPLNWDSKSKYSMCVIGNGEHEEYKEGYYQIAIDLSDYLFYFPTDSVYRSELVSICRKIANLPENTEA